MVKLSGLQGLENRPPSAKKDCSSRLLISLRLIPFSTSGNQSLLTWTASGMRSDKDSFMASSY